MNFMENLKNTLGEEFNVSATENGAVGYRTSGKELLDINFAVSSLRNENEANIERRFAKAFYEDKILAVKWLFYAGDVRGGLGERRLFRIGLKWLAKNERGMLIKLIPLVAEYTRWDNLLCLLDENDEKLTAIVSATLKNQLNSDMENMAQKKPISLCAKWMPSVNASSKETRKYAKLLAYTFGISEREYRKMLSALRAYLDVVEVKMSKKEWNAIEYSAVPSRANLIYNDAFLRNDEERRRKYLAALEKGETKINAGVLFPHDIVHKYSAVRGWSYSVNNYDAAIEQLWKALPDYVKDSGNTICVADGSGSMTAKVGNTNVSCLEVANALAIYFAERSSGQFKDNYITFSERPQLVSFANCNSLRDKIAKALTHNEVANTNIEAVFDLILQTAIKARMKQEDMPKNILILSDMEFDSCASANRGRPNEKLFAVIAQKYAEYGYSLPRLVFWNICSRTGTIPVKENKLGVALVSGFSPAIVKMVLSNQTDPFQCLLEQLNDERYAPVEQALR